MPHEMLLCTIFRQPPQRYCQDPGRWFLTKKDFALFHLGRRTPPNPFCVFDLGTASRIEDVEKYVMSEVPHF